MRCDAWVFRVRAAVLIGALFAMPVSAALHEVAVEALDFVPSEITVAQGDTVRWVWVTGSHTVTSGVPCTADGLFDAPLNVSNPTFEHVFDGAAGDYPYFCVPHCSFGMTGMVQVEAAIGAVGDPWGEGPGAWTRAVRLLAPSPNPFGSRTRLGFALARAGHVTLEVLDLEGRVVATPASGFRAEGEHVADWNGRGQRGEMLPSGAYFARIRANGGGQDVVALIIVR